MQTMNVAAAILTLTLVTAFADEATPAANWVPNSTVPLVQLTGEKFQYSAYNYYFKTDTPGTTLSNAGVYGADLGVPVTFPDKFVFLFGDSWSYYKDSSGKFIWYSGWGHSDSIAYLDRPVDLSACHFMEDIDKQIAAGFTPPVVDYSKSPVLKFYLKPTPIANQPLFQETAISNLAAGQALGSYEVPTGAFALNDRIYMFYNVKHQTGTDSNGKNVTFFLNTILARSDQTYSNWQSNAPPTFTRLYDVSAHPTVADLNNPPSDQNDFGKFIHVSPVVMDHATLAATGMLTSLPPSLQNAAQVVFLWGSSWRYVHSNLYLAAISTADIEAVVNGQKDISKWWYCSSVTNGVPSWTNDEKAATPLLDTWEIPNTPCIGEHSVIWCRELQQFVFACQDRYFKIKFRVASTPWTWSTETQTFGLLSAAAAKFIHRPNQDQITENCTPVYKPDGTLFFAPENSGATYGPYMLDTCTQNSDGSVTIYFTMSTWNPYNVFLMKTSFRWAPPRITGSLAATGVENSPFNYAITATPAPQSYSATGLPPGLFCDSSTGIISGVPTVSGEFTVVITATNPGGSATANLQISIAAPPPPPPPPPPTGEPTPPQTPDDPGAPAAPPVALKIQKLQCSVNLKAGGHDKVAIQGTFPNMAANFDLAGTVFTVNASGVMASFTLDKKGRGKSSAGSAALKIKTSKKQPSSGSDITFSIRLQSGTWSTPWHLTLELVSGTQRFSADINLIQDRPNHWWYGWN